VAVKKLGLIVNPIAGMGGRCGLKGTDGAEILARACELGAVAEAPARAGLALSRLAGLEDGIEVLTVSGLMGETEAREAGLQPTVLFSTNCDTTSGENTRRVALMMA
jgi:predicted polyphosphate/ATP-dependent NAD kinase